MKNPIKLFVLRLSGDSRVGCSAIIDVGGTYWRRIDESAAAENGLRREKLDIVVLDHRDIGGSPAAEIEKLKKAQPQAALFLVSANLDLNSVVNAMRIGVRDIFQPPLDYQVLANRLDAHLKETVGSALPAERGRWSYLGEFLGAPVAAPSASASSDSSQQTGGPSPEEFAELQELAAEFEAENTRLQTEIEALQNAPKKEQAPAAAAISVEQMAELEAELMTVRAEAESLQAQVENNKAAANEAKSAAQKEIEAQTAKTQEEREQIEKEANELRQKLASLGAEHHRVSEELELSQKKLVDQTAAIEHLRSDSAKLEEAHQQITSLQSERDSLLHTKSDLAESQKRCASAETELSKLKEQVTQLDAAAKEAHQRADAVEKSAKARKSEADKLVAETAALTKKEQAAIAKQRHELQKEKEQFETEKADLEQVISKREQAAAAREKAHEEALVSLNAERKQLMDERDLLGRQRHELAEENGRLTIRAEQIETSSAQNQAEQLKLETLANEQRENAENLAARGSELDELKAHLGEEETRLNNDRLQFEADRESHENDLREFHKRVEEFENRRRAIQDQMQQLLAG